MGPAAGGLLMSYLTIAGCFWVNALSFGAIIFALAKMRLEPHENTGPSKALKPAALLRGLVFIRRHTTLRVVIMLTAVVSFCGMSFGTLLPIFARDIFQTNEHGYTALLTCNGLGALAAASRLAFSRGMRHKGKRVLAGAFGFCVSTAVFAIMPSLWLGCAALLFSGFFLLTFLMTANTLVQTLSPDTLRGRIFAVYSMSLVGTTPVGAIVLGFAAKFLGARMAVLGGALIAASFALWVFFRFRGLWKEK
jgi:MFS family permease